jgi:hypothetical protein
METVSYPTQCVTIEGECVDVDLAKFKLKSNNISNLVKIQEAMNAMEEKTYTLDQVLKRVIGFYGKFVPFN